MSHEQRLTDGRREILLSQAKRRDAQRIVGRIEPMKRPDQKGFVDRYVRKVPLARWPG